MADFEYFRAEESDQFSFFRIPKALFTEKEFASLSTDAKVLYGILLDRISLSKKNGWIDSDGYVYIIYTIAELQELYKNEKCSRDCTERSTEVGRYVQ